MDIPMTLLALGLALGLAFMDWGCIYLMRARRLPRSGAMLVWVTSQASLTAIAFVLFPLAQLVAILMLAALISWALYGRKMPLPRRGRPLRPTSA